ncbi:MAG TPA: hypothetical protein VFE54_12820 [Mucilaginibacter sp.]|nr:hypothetical protein [Mucilaginibacter sp.]
MVKPVLTRTRKAFIVLSISSTALFICGFRFITGETEWLNWSNKALTESYNPSAEANLKKWEIILTPEHFIRLRKTFQHGKQEYFSFNLSRLDSFDYLGNINNGVLHFKTLNDDIIVQTYDDPKGNIDSMSTVLDIPVKSISPERLDSLNSALQYFKTKGL